MIILENHHLRIQVSPEMGGKISSVFNKQLNREFLWLNKNVPFVAHAPGSEYDPNFIGGIDELIPNDIPEEIDGIAYPDHGELWTTPLNHKQENDNLIVSGKLPLSGLFYSKSLQLADDSPAININYTIKNDSGKTRHFLWKLHAAIRISKGDKLVSSAKTAQVVDAEYSRFKKQLEPFSWPLIENTDASVIPAKTNGMDFFYLFDCSDGNMRVESAEQDALFAYEYDKKIFPYQWWFASYGGFMDHYTAILEPCTNMPILVKDAIAQKQCAILEPGQSLTTRVRIFAGAKKDYLPSS